MVGLDHLLKGIPDGIINRVQGSNPGCSVRLNELHILTLPETRHVTTAIIR